MNLTAVVDTKPLERVAQTGPRVADRVTRSIRQIVIGGQSQIVRDRLHGGNPLNARTGNLSRAVNQDVDVGADRITGSIGVDKTAPYGAVHEYGGTFDIPAHEVREHLSKSRSGNEFTVRAHIVAGHSATFPERSFLRSWLRDNEQSIRDTVAAAAWEGAKAA